MDRLMFVNLVTLQSATPPAAGAKASHLDPWQLVLEASPTVKLVLVVLVMMSLICWFIIGAKLFRLGRATRQSNKFLDIFWESGAGAGRGSSASQWNSERLEAIYSQLAVVNTSPLAKVFHAGYVELARVLGSAGARGGAAEMDNVERALRRASINEVTVLETMVPFLATTGSTAPFVGLFGTVWGIMNSFIEIGGQKSASLDVVAPGIAEALIATAVGLVAAIPAVMAYNYFLRRIHVLQTEMDAFQSDYLNIVRRHFLVH
jgi:biopolymer transport protein TolQ